MRSLNVILLALLTAALAACAGNPGRDAKVVPQADQAVLETTCLHPTGSYLPARGNCQPSPGHVITSEELDLGGRSRIEETLRRVPGLL